jgi:hypothetical protein
MKNIDYIKPRFATEDWGKRHLEAIHSPTGPERPLVKLLSAWINYAKQHAARFNSDIGSDYVLGDEWARIGFALRGLLNGESGRLDCGTYRFSLSETR